MQSIHAHAFSGIMRVIHSLSTNHSVKDWSIIVLMNNASTSKDSNIHSSSNKSELNKSGQEDVLLNALGNDPLAIWRTLNLKVSHDPQNIKLHVQRLLFGLENELADYIPGALQDLFISLQQTGLPLRQRMFSLLSPVMMQTDRVYFQRWLDEDSDQNLECRNYPGAVFSSQTCQGKGENSEQSLSGRAVQEPGANNPLAKARFEIEMGRIDKARSLLEALCAKELNNSEAINELQNLYRCTHNQAAYQSFIKQLQKSAGRLPELWEKFSIKNNSESK